MRIRQPSEPRRDDTYNRPRKRLPPTPCTSRSDCAACTHAPNIAQSVGFLTPRMIAGHWQAAFSGAGCGLIVEAALGVELRVLSLDAQAAVGQLAETAPLEARTQLEHLGNQPLRLAVALACDSAGKLILDAAAPLVQLLHQHADRLQHIERLEARDHHRPLVLLGEILIRPAADHGADVRGADEAVDAHLPPFAHFGRIQDALDRGRGHHMIAIDAEVAELETPCLTDDVRASRASWSRSRWRRTPPADRDAPRRSRATRMPSTPCARRRRARAP